MLTDMAKTWLQLLEPLFVKQKDIKQTRMLTCEEDSVPDTTAGMREGLTDGSTENTLIKFNFS